ncbi:MAG: hypothetical protein P4M11_12195 [Candidatus Pacebacteria bacterium]|nr:hypothetical protein [Candidatus Paceibacterota bacterium]
MKRIDEYSAKAQADLATCRTEEAKLRDEIVKDVHEVVERDNAAVLESLQPTVQQDYKSLKQSLKQAKEENEQLMKQLLTIRKECANMALQIKACDNKVAQLDVNLLGEALPAEAEELE